MVVREGLSFRSQAALQLRAFRVIRGDETVEEMICKLRSRPLSGLRARRIEQIKRLEDKTAPTIAKCNGLPGNAVHARGGRRLHVLMSDHVCGIIIVVCCLVGRDDFTQPTYSRRWHTALCGHCSPGPGCMAAMRPALRYTPLNPAGQGYFPGYGKVFSCGKQQGKVFG